MPAYRRPAAPTRASTADSDAAELVDRRFFPQHVSAMPEIEPIRAASLEQQVRALLSGEELAEWDRAAAAAKAEGSFFISQPHHCAVGVKPG